MNSSKFWLVLGVAVLSAAFFVYTALIRKTIPATKPQEVQAHEVKTGTQASSTVSEESQPATAEQKVDELINKACGSIEDNVGRTECVIDLLDRKAAEREWKQRKLETIKDPQISVMNLYSTLKDDQAKIRDWREGFEKFRDAWCNAASSFVEGSGIPKDIATCQLGFESRAIMALDYLYYQRIMEETYGSVGIKDFEPTKADIDKLTKTNKTHRDCIWAGEEKCQ